MYKLSCFNHSLHALASHRGVPSWHHMLTMMWLRKNHIFLLPSHCARLGLVVWIGRLTQHGDIENKFFLLPSPFAHLFLPVWWWTWWLWWFGSHLHEKASHIATKNLTLNKGRKELKELKHNTKSPCQASGFCQFCPGRRRTCEKDKLC